MWKFKRNSLTNLSPAHTECLSGYVNPYIAFEGILSVKELENCSLSVFVFLEVHVGHVEHVFISQNLIWDFQELANYA